MKKIIVNDKMQKNYVYTLVEKAGENFHAEFAPELTPWQMLEMGVFGGKYMTDCRGEFPADWFVAAKLSAAKRNAQINYFGVNASQPLSVWREKNWIHADDPRGWFQWYCRYYMGRRGSDDERQVKRWKMIKRHAAQIRLNCVKGDLRCRKRQRQALLHWAYDSSKL